MSFIAFLLIVASATLHAAWNLIAKKNTMSIVFYAHISAVASLCWFQVQLWTPIRLNDLPWEFWGSLAGSLLSDLFYCYGLVYTYRYMEMASAYPIMRSLPILLTAAVTGVLGWGTPLGLPARLGFFVVFIGALLMPLARLADFKISNYLSRNMFFVFLTACGTTGYTIFDSRAQFYIGSVAGDISKPVLSMTFYSIRTISLSALLWSIIAFTPSHRELVKKFWRERNFTPLLAGIFASGTYILVLLAMNYVTNVSYVQVFRQLGLPIGMAAGVWILKERCTAVKCVGVCLILLGLAISLLR